MLALTSGNTSITGDDSHELKYTSLTMPKRMTNAIRTIIGLNATSLHEDSADGTHGTGDEERGEGRLAAGTVSVGGGGSRGGAAGAAAAPTGGRGVGGRRSGSTRGASDGGTVVTREYRTELIEQDAYAAGV